MQNTTRRNVLYANIAKCMELGYVVVARNDAEYAAVLLRPGRPISHWKHAIASSLTSGLWMIGWLIIYLTRQKPHYILVRVTENIEVIIEDIENT